MGGFILPRHRRVHRHKRPHRRPRRFPRFPRPVAYPYPVVEEIKCSDMGCSVIGKNKSGKTILECSKNSNNIRNIIENFGDQTELNKKVVPKTFFWIVIIIMIILLIRSFLGTPFIKNRIPYIHMEFSKDGIALTICGLIACIVIAVIFGYVAFSPPP